MNNAHEINSAADAIRQGAHSAECPVHDHEECVRKIVRDEREREQLERDARRLRNLQSLAIVVLVVGGAIAAERVLR